MLPDGRSRDRLVVAVVGALLLASVVGGMVTAQHALADTEDSDVIEPADDVYITEDGAVLVYESETTDSEDVVANFGGDVATGLVNGVVEIEDNSTEDVHGSLGVELSESTLAGDGNITVRDVDDVGEFAFSAEGEHSSTDSYLTSEFEGQIDAESQMTTGTVQGEFVATADQLTFTTDVEVGGEPADSAVVESIDVLVEQRDNGFTASVDRRRQLLFGAEQWETREKASQALEQRYGPVAESLGGTVDITIESYAFEAGDETTPATLDIGYTVRLDGVRDRLSGMLVDALVADGTINISEAEATALEESLDELELTRVEASYVQGEGGAVSGSTTVVLSNYQEPVLAYMDSVAVEDGVLTQDQVEEARAVFEAQESADLTQELSWSVAVEPAAESGMSVVSGDVSYETENWEAYVQERHGGDLSNQPEATFDVDAESDGDTIDLEMSFRIDHDDFVDEALDQATSGLQGETNAGVGDDSMQFLEAFDDSDIKVAQSDIVFGNETVEVQAAGQFENLSAFHRIAPADSTISHIYGGSTGEDTAETYVYVEDRNLTAETVRETPFADANTTVHPQGEWDREFPRMDTGEVGDYLGVEVDNEEGDRDDDGGDVPAILILVGGAAIVVTSGVLLVRYR
ncbi:MAG: hypothetical protein V5A52_06385 [Halovenus sp.]